MAKLQKSTLDPSKVSGRCGRLRCCLRYEHCGYEELAQRLPRADTRVETEFGAATVVDRQILTQLVLVRTDDNRIMSIPLEEIRAFNLPLPPPPPPPPPAAATTPAPARAAPAAPAAPQATEGQRRSRRRGRGRRGPEALPPGGATAPSAQPFEPARRPRRSRLPVSLPNPHQQRSARNRPWNPDRARTSRNLLGRRPIPRNRFEAGAVGAAGGDRAERARAHRRARVRPTNRLGVRERDGRGTDGALRADGSRRMAAIRRRPTNFCTAGWISATRTKFGAAAGGGSRHVTGQELCHALRLLAVQMWGPLRREVLRRWNIRRTRDFGEMVFLMIDLQLMGKQDSDDISDFDDVYDFDTAFGSYQIALDSAGRKRE